MKELLTYENLIGVLIVTAGFALLWVALRVLFKKLNAKAQNDARLRAYALAEKICKWLLLILAVLNILSIFPAVKSLAASLLAGSGIAAIIISVASQEALSNFVSGIIIIFSKTYKVGDRIRYTDTGTVGIVEEIKMRHTVIRTFENTRLIVPNSLINNVVLENYTYNDNRVCIHLNFDITYESDMTRAMMLIGAVIAKHPEYTDVRSDEAKANGVPPVTVVVNDFTESAVRLRAYMWVKDAASGERMKSDVLMEIKRRFDASGIEFAYPHVQVV
ncbi:MAG: mechanosensitive ion channel family protein [Clostridia bacterium]|nr:mechanosensitive ion channel family protein [Clostridia bacterium]